MRHLTAALLACVLLVPSGVSAVAQDGAGASGSAPENEPPGGDVVDATPEARARAMVGRWRDLVVKLEDSVRRADENALQEMRGPAEELLDEMVLHVATGHEELLARALRLRDLVAPARSTMWRVLLPRTPRLTSTRYLHLARQLWPPVTQELEAFGDPGRTLRRELRDLDRRAEKLRKEAHKARSKKDFVPPNRQGSHEIRYPPAAGAVDVESVVRIRYLVDEGGVPFAPEVLDEDVPSSLLLAGLQTVLAARYEPAMVGTRMVPAEITMAVRFEKP